MGALTDPIELKTDFGAVVAQHFRSDTGEECVVVSKPSIAIPLVRVHSSCLFSESFQANDCDCARQLSSFLDLLGKEGGYLFYQYQEGRGAGIEAKFNAISLQQRHDLNTTEAYDRLGLVHDLRDYNTVTEAMRAVNVPKDILLATNNREKIAAISAAGYNIHDRVELDFETNPDIDAYLQEKVKCLGHHARK